jgi:uncharacterized protein YjbI with pentapeptide repeats
MAKDSVKSSDDFEPPKYLASLIAAVNDGAKAAQGGALAFALVGVYLLATAFSTSDEDLLLGRAVTISQIGATLPVSFSFAIAPFVFVFLHIYTLARYDMLAANVRQFLVEVRRTVALESDRERCRQLLANVEFIQALIAPPGSRLYSPVWRWLVRAVVAVFPVVVLLLVLVNALRYQSELITGTQQLWVFLDLSVLVWFFRRSALDGSQTEDNNRPGKAKRWAKLIWLPLTIISLTLVYLNVVPAEADISLIRYLGPPFYESLLERTQEYLANAVNEPLDTVLCPSLKWGCRYLRVDHRTLVGHVWDDKAMVDLIRGDTDKGKIAAIEGLVLRDRSLRFAVLDGSFLFAADLIGTDLRRASLQFADLSDAKLAKTKLQGVDLTGAKLRGARFRGAQMQNANLNFAQLQNADLGNAQLRNANLSNAQLQGANLEAELQGAVLYSAHLQGAILDGAQLPGANLRRAELQGAHLRRTQLQAASIDGANLQAADLTSAQLQGANLSSATLEGADLRGARLWRTVTDSTVLSLSDLRADFTTPASNPEIDAPNRMPPQLHLAETWPHLLLVSDPNSPVFAKTPKSWLITATTQLYNDSLVALVVNISSSDPDIARGIASGASYWIQWARDDDKVRWRYSAIACHLLANAEAKKVKLDQSLIDELSGALQRNRIQCDAKNAGPH